MILGILSDLHLGYSHGTKTLPDGTNVRESDVYNSAHRAVRNLLNAGVSAICDLGDLAHVPHPKKRAIRHLISLINEAGVDWYSCGGNHTAQRTSSDSHLYELLVDQCPRFYGAFTGPQFFEDIGAYLIPYDTSENIERALEAVPQGATFIGGHWTFDDADWPGEHVPSAAMPDLPVLLGHWHKRVIKNRPVYIGATDRFAWGEAYNPCGAAIFDTETGQLEFIDHQVRRWVDITVTPDDYLEGFHYENIEDCIARVNVVATPAQYHSLNLLHIKKKMEPSMEYQIRRIGSEAAPVQSPISPGSLSVVDVYRQRIKKLKVPHGVSKKDVERIGLLALEG